MNYVLMVFLLGMPGPYFNGMPFATLEDCRAEQAKLPKVLAEENAKNDGMPVDFYATACAPVKKAPKGKDV